MIPIGEGRSRSFGTLRIAAPRRADTPALLLMLPGVGLKPRDFVENGLVDRFHRTYPGTDVAALDVDTMAYLDGTLAGALHEEIVLPARQAGYLRISFAGISLGGMGALLYARRYAPEIDAIVLLAPFIGTPGMIAEVERAGGFSAWEPGTVKPSEIERGLLAWLKAYGAERMERPVLSLGFGTEDRFATGSRLLSSILPSERVIACPGIHDWTAWSALWSALMARGPFGEMS